MTTDRFTVNAGAALQPVATARPCTYAANATTTGSNWNMGHVEADFGLAAKRITPGALGGLT
ncbi:MAG: hypothetical protein AAGG08_04850 [Actinomycetota bacterium]